MLLDSSERARLIRDVCEFVRIPSRSGPEGGEEGTLQRLIAARMAEAGARVRTISVDDLPGFRSHPLCHGPGRDYRDRPTVVGEIGPAGAPALLLLAHSDTVQITDPPSWTFDPFCGEVRDGRIRGLGASDDKWGLGVMLAVLRQTARRGSALTKRLIFVSSIDEENGVSNGMLVLLLAKIKAQAALYLDGSGMRPLIGNLGGSNLYLRPTGAVEATALDQDSARLKEALAEFSRRRTGLFDRPFFADNLRRNLSAELVRRRDDRGEFLLIPFYTLSGEDRSGFRRALERVVSDALGERWERYERTYREPWFEPNLTSPTTPLVRHVAEAVRSVTGRTPSPGTITKQDRFVLGNHMGIPTVSFGPRSGNRETSPRGAEHQPDEAIAIDELHQGAEVTLEAVNRWLEDQA